MATRNYTNSAQPQLLTSALNNTDTTSAVSVGSTSTFPTAPFIITIDRGLWNQEVMLCTATPDTSTFTVTRGYGSTKHSHSINAIVEHTAAAIDYAEPNTFINTYTSAGDLVQGTSTSGVVSRLAIGTQGKVLTSTGTGISWATAPTNTGPQGAQGVPGPATVPPYMFAVPGSGSAMSFASNGVATPVPLTYAVQSLGGANIPTLAGNTITLPLQGVYQFSASVGITNLDTANYITAQVVTNDGGSSASNVTYIGSSGSSGASAGQGGQSHVSGTIKFTLANSTIKLRAQSWDGGTPSALNYGQTSPYQTYLTVHYVGPIA